jgi:general stress protein 26
VSDEKEEKMADLKEAKRNPEKQLWEEIEDIHAGMLGIDGSGQHMQPMAPYVDRDSRCIWFFTSRSSDLVEALGNGAKAHFTVVGEGHDYHACIAGRLTVNNDRRKIDEYWSPVVAAWYEKGKDDPEVTLLQFRPLDAAIWASPSSALRFGWEIAKANLTKSEPDVGVRNHVQF